MSDYYPPNSRVLVVRPGDDPYLGQVGTVTGTRNDAGDMVHRVRFCIDHEGTLCHTAYYFASELRRAPRQED